MVKTKSVVLIKLCLILLLVSLLFSSRTQAHIFHLQTMSFAEHKALNKYYDSIVDIIDQLVEAYQGKYGIINHYTNVKLVDYTNKQQVIQYFEGLMKSVETLRSENLDSYLQNIIDTIIELISSTLYKLKYLN